MDDTLSERAERTLSEQVMRATSDESGALPRPPFHPHVHAAIDQIRLPPFTHDRLEQLRRQNAGHPDDLEDDGLERRDIEIPTPDGATIKAALWSTPDAEPATCYVWLHGGGMVSGDRFNVGDILPHVKALGGVLLSVDYRLAPEHPAPTPVEDCYAALVWAVEHADELGFDPRRVILGGTSAGGGLAAGVLLLLRDRKGPDLLGAWLNCPMLDDRNDTVSMRQFERLGLFWCGVSNQTGWDALLGDARGTDDVPAAWAPARADWLGDLPPVLITVGAAEVFRDEAVAFATGLWRDGVDCELVVVPGGTHCFTEAAPEASITRLQHEVVFGWLGAALQPDLPDTAESGIERLKALEKFYVDEATPPA